jgi:hypothetical protein
MMTPQLILQISQIENQVTLLAFHIHKPRYTMHSLSLFLALSVITMLLICLALIRFDRVFLHGQKCILPGY